MDYIKKFTQKVNEDHISAYAAQSSFFLIVSLFPLVILLFTIIQYTNIPKQLILEFFLTITPQKLNPLIEEFIIDVYRRPSIALFSTNAIITLWISGKTFLGIIKGLNTIYGVKEARNYIIRRILASIYTLIFIIVLILSMVFLVFGNRIITHLSNTAPILFTILTELFNHKFILIQCFLTIFFMLLYKSVPSYHNSLIKELPGAAFAAAGWQFFSYIYSIYVDKSSNFDAMYGRLSVIIFAMLWLYFCITIFFYGAIINVLLFSKSE